LKDGVEGKNSSEIASFIDKYGLSLSTSTANDYSAIECSSLTENSGKCIELLDLLVKKATFTDGEYKKYMKKRVEYYHANTASANYLGNKLLYHLVFGKHNYGYYDVTLKTLSNIKLEDIKNFYKDYFNPKNAYIIVSGKYSDEVLNDIKAKFTDWTDGKVNEVAKTNRIAPLKEKRSLIYVIDRPGSKQVVINYGQTIMPYNTSKFLPFYMGNKVLGESSSSRLFMRLREKESLTYGVYSYLTQRLESGIFLASLSVRSDVVGKAVTSLLDELTKFKKSGITKDELDDKKGLEYGSFAMKLQGFGYVSMLLQSKFLNLPTDYFKNYLSNLSKLTVENINSDVQEVITPENGKIVIVGDSKTFIEQLKPLGQAVILDENFKPLKK
jgi:predicted Zn-dependent peptidase